MIGKVNILAGTTASGKTKYAVELAKEINAVVINCDSMQVYKEIPILTAQPTEEEKQGIEHRLYGVISCGEEYNVGIWLNQVEKEIKEVLARGKTPLLVGGTGLYIKSLVRGISELPTISSQTKEKLKELQNLPIDALYSKLKQTDNIAASRLEPGDVQRILRALAIFMETGKSIYTWHENAPITKFFPQESFYLMWLKKPRETIYNNINYRFLQMIEMDVVEEVKKLKKDITLPKAHGLPEIIKYLKGELALEQAIAIAQQNTRNYAKRQITFFSHQLEFDKVIEG